VKFLTLFFAVYILLLPCIPCTDAEECDDISKTEISHSADHTDHQDDDEACNPFCSCACCGHIFVPNFQVNKTGISKPIDGLKQQYFYKSIFLSSDCFGNIWQPPKLV
jgi:hypothetical protein